MKKLLYYLFLFWVIPIVAYSQTYQISGTVTDATDGSPLPGVTIKNQRNEGTVADLNGKYTFQVEKGDVLTFSFLGMLSQEIKVRNQQEINVALKADDVVLGDVVIIGYGTAKKGDLAGASSSISEEKLKGSLATNIDQALQGRAAGINSVRTSGAPGSSVSISIRGQATINAGSEPLYVVDGVIWQGGTTKSLDLGLNLGNGKASQISPLSNLNPSDVVSIEILKDASATAIYGAQGANGVVLISTKRGKTGKAKFTYEGMYAVSNQYKRLDIMDLREFATFSNAVRAIDSYGRATEYDQSEYADISLLGRGTDWQSAIFRTAPMQSHNISAQGGSENMKYFVSGSYMKQDGTIIGTDFDRYSFRVNLDAKLTNWLSLGINSMYSHTGEHLNSPEGTEGVLTFSLQTPPDIPIYDEFGHYASQVREGYSVRNPIAIAQIDENIVDRQKLNGNFFLEIKPFKDLNLHSELDYDIGNTRSENWKPTYDFGESIRRPVNSITWQRSNNRWWAIKNYLTYDKQAGLHHLTAMLGQEAWESNWEMQRIQSSALPGNELRNPQLGDPDTYNINDGQGDGAMASFFTRETYNYDDRYLLTYTFRRDGSSSFGPKNRWANFHAAAVAWRFSNESFFQSDHSILSNGKLRLGWGQTGNSSIAGGLWDASLQMFPTGLGAAYKQSQIANPFIQWETQTQWNIGLDLSFFSNRLNLVIDTYDKTSNNLLMQLQLPSYFGSRGNGNSALTAPMGNFGEINNKGLEIALNTVNIDRKDFKWSTDFQISFNKNKLVALQGTDATGIEGYGQWNDVICLSPIGGSLYQFYGYTVEGVYRDKADIESHLWGEKPANGTYLRNSTVYPGDIKYRDLNGDGKIDTDDRTFIGSPLPKFTYGFNNTFVYKDFDLNIFIQGSYGNKIFNALDRSLTGMGWFTNQLKKVMDFARLEPIDPNKQYPVDNPYFEDPQYVYNTWYDDIDNVRVANPGTQMPRAGRSIPYTNNQISTRYIEDGSYLRVKNIALGYSVPSKFSRKYQIDNLRLYINLQNVWTFTKYTGYDPEVGSNPQDASGYTFGFDLGRYPSPRTLSFGVNISF